jgi:hypothetical protein
VSDFGKALLTDPLSAMTILRGALGAHGIEGADDQNKEIFKIIGRQTTERLVSDFLTNLTQMIAERGRIFGAQGLDAQNETREQQDYDRNIRDVEASWQNFMTEATSGRARRSTECESMRSDLKFWIVLDDGKGVEVLAAVADLPIAREVFRIIAAQHPTDEIHLKRGARIIPKSAPRADKR